MIWEKVDAVWRDVVYLAPKMHIVMGSSECEIKGHTLYRYGQHVATWGLVDFNNKPTVFLAAHPKMRAHARKMVVEGRLFMEGLSNVYTYADTGISGSNRYILHFGFIPTGKDLHGMKEYYYGSSNAIYDRGCGSKDDRPNSGNQCAE